jgi:hypothetical protein
MNQDFFLSSQVILFGNSLKALAVMVTTLHTFVMQNRQPKTKSYEMQGEPIEMKTININLSLFKDGDYMLLLSAKINGTNVRLHDDGTVTICFTEEDVETFKNLPRMYQDIDNLNRERKYENNINVTYGHMKNTKS